MEQLTQTDLDFLRRFARSPDGRLWVELLERKLTDADRRLRTAIGEDVLRSQGRAQLLAELIDDVMKAQERFDRTALPPKRRVVPAEAGTWNPSQ